MFTVAGGIILALFILMVLIGFGLMVRDIFRFVRANAMLVVSLVLCVGIAAYSYASYH